MLGRRLQDVEDIQWTEAVKNDHLNRGLQYMQQVIMEIDPMAFVYECTANTVSGTAYYPMPSNSMFEVGVFQKSSAGGEYAWLDFIEMPWIQAGGSANWEANPFASGYSRQGRYLVIHPTPTSSVSAGLKLQYVPWLVMGADTDIPEIDVGLQEGIVYRAEEIALGETAQEAVKAKEDLAQVLARLPRYYRRRGGTQRFNPQATLAQYEE